MADPLKGFDWTAPDFLERLKEIQQRVNAEAIAARQAFVALLPPELAEAYYATCDALQGRNRVEGAFVALAGEAKRDRQAVHTSSQSAAHYKALTTKQEAELQRLRVRTTQQARQLMVLQEARAPQPAPAPQEAPSAPPEPPQWDYKPVPRRRPQRGEVVTDTPFGVEVVARHVEEYVRKNGPCKKPDISAAFPLSRPYLSDAYRHLHSSRRVEVDGWSLRMWPTNG